MSKTHLSDFGGLDAIISLADRFWSHVEIPQDRSQCWIWTGATTGCGYGKMHVGGRQIIASRLSYLIAHGTIDDSMFVCHSCDNPICVNPDHIWQGSPADNVRDMVEKGRAKGAVRGDISRNPSKNAILTKSKVIEIYSMFKSGKSQSYIARSLGLHRGTVFDIVRKRTRADITDRMD